MEPSFAALFLTGGEDLLQEVMVHGAVAGGGGAVQPAEEGGQQYSGAEHGTGSGGWRWRGLYISSAGGIRC